MPLPEVYEGRDFQPGEIVIPEFLSPGQSILSQPPYEWILNDQNLTPNFIFNTTYSAIFILRSVVELGLTSEVYGDKLKYILENGDLVDQYFNTDYRDSKTVMYTMSHILKEFEENYPYSMQYLLEFWIEKKYFSYMGRMKKTCPLDMPTYAAYAYDNSQSAHVHWMNNIKQITPQSIASSGNVSELATHAHRASRLFRMIHT